MRPWIAFNFKIISQKANSETRWKKFKTVDGLNKSEDKEFELISKEVRGKRKEKVFNRRN